MRMSPRARGAIKGFLHSLCVSPPKLIRQIAVKICTILGVHPLLVQTTCFFKKASGNWVCSLTIELGMQSHPQLVDSVHSANGTVLYTVCTCHCISQLRIQHHSCVLIKNTVINTIKINDQQHQHGNNSGIGHRVVQTEPCQKLSCLHKMS